MLKGVNMSVNFSILNDCKPVAQSGYSRLKRIFTNDLKYRDYNQITDTTKNKILGNIPPEFLNAALKTKDKEQTIKKLQKGFAQAASELLKLQSFRSTMVKGLKPDKADVMKTYQYLLNGEYEQHEFLKKRLEKAILSSDIIKNHEQQAAKLLKEAMAEILPENTIINFKSLGLGNFAEAYKIEFRDRANQKIFNDYTIKLYRDRKESNQISLELNNKIKETLYGLDNQEIKELYKEYPVYKNGTKEDWERIFKNFRKENKPFSPEELEAAKKKDTHLAAAYCSNGVKAEANTYFYIQKALGHSVHNTNLNKHFMFDIENRFNISAFSDKTIPRIKKRINFSQLGLIPIDSYDNYSNIVYGRIIDVGGMSKKNDILTDKTVRKFYKKIVNRNTKQERQQVVDNLKKLAKNPKTPDRKKILAAIEYAESPNQIY